MGLTLQVEDNERYMLLSVEVYKNQTQNTNFQTLKWGGGLGFKRPAPPLAPPLVNNTPFCHFELFCHFYVLNVRVQVAPSGFF